MTIYIGRDGMEIARGTERQNNEILSLRVELAQERQLSEAYLNKIAHRDTECEELRQELAAMTAERDSLRMVLKGIQEMASESIRMGNVTSATCVYQVEANAREALEASKP